MDTACGATLDGFPLLVLKGTPAERGRDHGFLCAREIIAVIDGLLPIVKSRRGGPLRGNPGNTGRLTASPSG